MEEEHEELPDSSDLEESVDADYEERRAAEEPQDLDLEHPPSVWTVDGPGDMDVPEFDQASEALQGDITRRYQERNPESLDRPPPAMEPQAKGTDSVQEIVDAFAEIVRDLLEGGIEGVKEEMKDETRMIITESIIPTMQEMVDAAIEDLRDEMNAEILKVDRLGG